MTVAPFYADDAVTIWHADARRLPLDDATVDLALTSPRPANRPLRGRRDVPVKSLMGLPWRFALRCVDELGLILRAEVVWSKPNGLPESVTDRVRRSHEQWFHLVKRPRYYAAVDAIREPYASGRGAARIGDAFRDHVSHTNRREQDAIPADYAGNPLGKLPGSVWEVATQPLKVPAELGVDHFAAFPMEWPRRIIRGWSPSGICVECGEGRMPVAQQTDEAYAAERAKVRESKRRTAREQQLGDTFGSIGGRTNSAGHSNISNGVVRPSYAITGESCACPEPTAPTRPAVVLDPFGGTGTTALVARALGRRAHLVDLSADYCRLARWRVTDPGELARALQVDKPPTPPQGIPSLLDLLDDEAVTG